VSRVVVAMSGGVDSSVTALLLLKEGYEVIGLTMNISVSSTSINDAKKVAYLLNIPHYVINLKREFEETIVKYFVESYEKGYTPNPCMFCNRFIKFGLLMKRAKEISAEYFATGHYVKKEWDQERKVFLLKRAKDERKDQSYFLAYLTQEQIEKSLFPLGDYTKEEVRRIARENNLVTEEKSESQEICFLPNNDYREFIKKYVKEKKGKIITEDGRIVGEHDGVFSFTIGQRKGLKVAMGKPVYVKEIVPEEGLVIVAERERILSNLVYAKNLNFPSFKPKKKRIDVFAMIRYNMKPQPAELKIISEDEVIVEFKEPQWAPAPGQILVCYLEDFVLCGGIIEKMKSPPS